MLAIVAGFVGVLLVMHPGIGTVHWAMLLALVATLGLRALQSRHALSRRLRPAGGDADLYAARRASWCWRRSPSPSGIWPADAWPWLLLASLGFWGGLGHWLLILAHRSAPAAGAGAVHLSRADLDVGAGLPRVRRRADAGGRCAAPPSSSCRASISWRASASMLGDAKRPARLRHRLAVIQARRHGAALGRPSRPGWPSLLRMTPGPRTTSLLGSRVAAATSSAKARSARRNRLARAGHQLLIELDIGVAQQHGAERLARLHQMMQISALVLRGGTGALRIERRWRRRHSGRCAD